MASTSTDIERRRSADARRGESVPGMGLLKGLGVTIKHLFRRTATQRYPDEKPDLAPRTRGVIALMDENCTVCMLCARECPDWCIYIDSHKETVPPAREGGRERTRNVLDRFAIDFALCMYCGICVEVCPFDALFWSPEFEYSEYDIDGLLHEKEKLREWMDTVPPPPLLDEGADSPPEVADAIEQADRELARAREERRKALEESESGQAPADADEPGADEGEPEIEVEGAGEELDQETFDRLIEEGKSERIARAKAKAAYIRKARKQARGQAETDQADEDVEVEGAGEELDQETFDRLIEEGKSERIARSKAKAAYIRKARKQARGQAAGDGGAGAGTAAPVSGDDAAPDTSESDTGGSAAATATATAPGGIAEDRRLADLDDGLDEDLFDRLVDEGHSERIARARARAARVRRIRQAAEEGDGQ